MAFGDFFTNLASGSGSGLGADFGGVGLGLSAVGAIEGIQTANKEAAVQTQIAGVSQNIFQQQMNVNAQRQQQMFLDTQRQQIQNVRNFQRARAQGLTNAVSGGSQFSSGLSGAYGQQSGQANTNALGNSQNFQVGQNIFGFTNAESIDKMQIAGLQGTLANLQGQGAVWQGIGGAGQGMLAGAGSFGKLFGNS